MGWTYTRVIGICLLLLLTALGANSQTSLRIGSKTSGLSDAAKGTISQRKHPKRREKRVTVPIDTLLIGGDTLRFQNGKLVFGAQGQVVSGYEDPAVYKSASYQHVLFAIPKSSTFYILHFRQAATIQNELEQIAESYSRGHFTKVHRPVVFEAHQGIELQKNGLVASFGDTEDGWIVLREAGRLYSFRLLKGKRGEATSTFARLPSKRDSVYQNIRLTNNVLLLDMLIGSSVQQLAFEFWQGKLLPKLPSEFELGGNTKSTRIVEVSRQVQAHKDSLFNQIHNRKRILEDKKRKIDGTTDSLSSLPSSLESKILSKKDKYVLRADQKLRQAVDSNKATADQLWTKRNQALQVPTANATSHLQQKQEIGSTTSAKSQGQSMVESRSNAVEFALNEQAVGVSHIVDSARVRAFPLTKRNGMGDKRSNIWYFGHGAGLDLNGDTVAVLHDGKIAQLEGSASIADTNGRLLLYTDGKTIFNRSHQPVQNGTGLKGHPSASTAALIVPAPGTSHIFYVLTSDEGGYIKTKGNGIHYSVVDMSSEEGAVTIKNRVLLPDASERLAAVQHADGSSIWILAQPAPGNELHAYLLDSIGLSHSPIISKTLVSSLSGNGSIGVLKFSPDGKRLAITNTGSWDVELYEFNTASGKAENGSRLRDEAPELAVNNPYGLAFSPNNQKLYIGEWESGVIHQFDVGNGTFGKHHRFELDVPHLKVGALQLTSNGQVLIATVGPAYQRNQFLSAILNPNEEGLAAGFVTKAIRLRSVKASLGLPSFPNFIIQPVEANIQVNGYCTGSSTVFDAVANVTVDNWKWSFGDGKEETLPGQIATVSHSYAEPGVYHVRLIAIKSNSRDTVWHLLKVGNQPQVNAGSNMVLTKGSSCTIEATGVADWWYWSTGETKQQISVSRPGRYIVVAGNAGCINSDTVLVLPGEQQLDVNQKANADPVANPNRSVVLSMGKPSAVERALTWLIDHHTLTYSLPYNNYRWNLPKFQTGSGIQVYRQYGSEQLTAPTQAQSLQLQKSSNTLWLIGIRFSPN